MNTFRISSIQIIARVILPVALALAHPLRASDPVSFSREILPILSDNCFKCHGPDEQARKSRLRLDTPEGALGKGKSGEPAIVPKDSKRSEVIRRLTTDDPEEIMPPPKSNRHLSSAQIELIRRWIDQGAPWGRHWAFEPPVRPPVPARPDGIRNPIDAFVHERMTQEGLRASPEATTRTLIRRAAPHN